MKRDKIIFYVFTGLLTLLVGMGAIRYFVDHQWAVDEFGKLGFPEWLIYPLGVAKIVGLTAIWFVKNETIKLWAYAGFSFNFFLAIGAHVGVGDGEAFGGAIAFVMLASFFIFYRRSLKAAV